MVITLSATKMLERALSDTPLRENPLVPNRRLREMYVAMFEARLLDDHCLATLTTGKKPNKLSSRRGEEACRISTAIDLQPGDLISDSRADSLMDLLGGTKVERLLRQEHNRERASEHESTRVLPWVRKESERLLLAMGAALSLKMRKQSNLILAYAQGPMRKLEWRSILELASRLELPILFVALPLRTLRGKQTGRMSAKLGTSLGGVPIIAVDASDAVAIYRVAQEALGRIRNGGGPVLIECVDFRPEGTRNRSPADPVLKLRRLLLEREIATTDWLDRAGDRLRRQIQAARL